MITKIINIPILAKGLRMKVTSLKAMAAVVFFLAQFSAQLLAAGATPMPQATPKPQTTPMPQVSPTPTIAPTTGPTCNPKTIEPSCNCQTAENAYRAVADVINGNIMVLNGTKAQLSAQWQQLDQVERELVHAGDNFEIQMVSRCTIAALEAVAVGKAFTTLKAACATGSWAAQCAIAGVSTKEVMQYLAKSEAIQAAAITIFTQSANIIAKQNTSSTPGWMKVIPIVGSACNAYDYSNKIFTAPEAIAEIGRQKAAISRLKAQIDGLIAQQQQALRDAAAERDRKCGR